MTSGLLLAAVMMGAVGIPHCLVMCGVPCSVAVQSCSDERLSQRALAGALQLGRLVGYALLGALAASLVSFAHLLASHVAALRPLWVMAQVAILILGVLLACTGHLPQWLQTAQVPLYKLSARLTQGWLGRLPPLVRTALVGVCWAVLPCAQLYAAVVLAAMADNALGGALVMSAYASPSVLSLWLGSHWLMRILGRNTKPASQPAISSIQITDARGRWRTLDRFADASWAVRVTGAVLAASAALMLTHSAGKIVQAICG